MSTVLNVQKCDGFYKVTLTGPDLPEQFVIWLMTSDLVDPDPLFPSWAEWVFTKED